MTIPTMLLAVVPFWLLPSGADIPERMPQVIAVSSQVRCSIRAEKDDSGVRLSAVISAGSPVAGSYTFRVQPQGGGAPLIDEKGDFEIKADGPSEVKQATLELPAGQGYSAALSIVWPNGSSSCSASAS